MATKRKVRRFDEGGMTDDEVASFAGTPENESNAGMAEAYKEPETKTTTFKEAFAAARKSGDKVFEWNGKKYTSDLATEKKAAPKVEAATKSEPVAEKPKLRYQSLQDRARDYEAERAKSGVGMYGTKKSEPKEERKPLPLRSTKSETGNKFMGSLGLKKGGSVSSASRRADGIATKGKTKGRMV